MDITYIIYLIHIHVLIRAVTWTWVTIFGAVVEFSISTNVADLLSEGLDGMELLELFKCVIGLEIGDLLVVLWLVCKGDVGVDNKERDVDMTV